MMKYKVMMAETLINEKQLEELANDGWQLVSIVPVGLMYYFYFVKTGVMYD